MNRFKLWQEHPNWESAEKAWDAGVPFAAQKKPIKSLDKLPNMPGITPDAKKNLKWKSLKWMVMKDEGFKIFRAILKHPFKYGLAFAKSVFKTKSYKREGDFFLYGVDSIPAFEKLLADQNNLFVIGFSYCEKPFECPSGRFTDQCIHEAEHPVCRQCFVGKSLNALPEKNTYPLLIPTIHYIGEKIFEVVHANPGKRVLFVITACEMTLEMFGDWGNMVNIQGLGVRLDGRICNTMKAFELSEQGIKPGLTVVLKETQDKILQLIKLRC